MICAAFYPDIRMSAGGGETSWNEKFEHENVRKNCRKFTLREDKPVFGRHVYRFSEMPRDLHILPVRFICPRIEKSS